VEGIIVASATPRLPGAAKPNVAELHRLVDFYWSRGAVGVLTFGTTGEFPHFHWADKVEASRDIRRESKIPVLLNVSDSCFDTSVAMALAAAQSKLDAVVLLPPIFFKYSQQDLLEFYLKFADAVDGRIPIYLYNIPAFTGPLEAETAIQLVETGRFAGMKDSSSDADYAEKMLRSGCARFYLGGDGLIARFRPRGASGGVSGIATGVPELLVSLDKYALAGDEAKVAPLQQALEEYIARLWGLPIPVLLKETARWRGFDMGEHSVPLSETRLKRLAEDRAWFDEWWSKLQPHL
jgi:dihydrodipicolinate synthase/N-acetylneuraminate lyase